MEQWVPLTQFAIEEGVSISTLRRKIKANKIEYRLDNGRYLIRTEDSQRGVSSAPQRNPIFDIQSSDDRGVNSPMRMIEAARAQVTRPDTNSAEVDRLEARIADFELRWKAMEARIHGLAKKVDFLVEQNSELNMLVKVFEEKLNATI